MRTVSIIRLFVDASMLLYLINLRTSAHSADKESFAASARAGRIGVYRQPFERRR